MNGINSAVGLSCSSMLTSAAWNQKTQSFFINPATTISIFTGDLVVVEKVGDSLYYIKAYPYSPPGPSVPFGQTDDVLGVFQGCFYSPANKSQGNAGPNAMWLAGTKILSGTQIQAFVTTDPTTIGQMQANNDVPMSFNVGFCNAQLASSNNTDASNPWGGNLQTGISGMMVDYATLGKPVNADQQPLKVLGVNVSRDNNLNQYTTLDVVINNSVFSAGTVI